MPSHMPLAAPLMNPYAAATLGYPETPYPATLGMPMSPMMGPLPYHYDPITGVYEETAGPRPTPLDVMAGVRPGMTHTTTQDLYVDPFSAVHQPPRIHPFPSVRHEKMHSGAMHQSHKSKRRQPPPPKPQPQPQPHPAPAKKQQQQKPKKALSKEAERLMKEAHVSTTPKYYDDMFNQPGPKHFDGIEMPYDEDEEENTSASRQQSTDNSDDDQNDAVHSFSEDNLNEVQEDSVLPS